MSHHPAKPPTPDESSEISPDSSAGPINWVLLHERLPEDDAFILQMIELLTVQAPQFLAELDQSIRTRDPELLIRAAHTLAGSAFHFGAESVVRAALQLEAMGHAGTFEGAESALETLKREVDLMLDGLANGLR